MKNDDVFAVQNGRDCYSDKLIESTPDRKFDRFGLAPAASCQKLMSSVDTNMVYLKKVLPKDPEWVSLGCFNEKQPDRAIPNSLGDVKSKEECQQRAEAKGYSLIGL